MTLDLAMISWYDIKSTDNDNKIVQQKLEFIKIN